VATEASEREQRWLEQLLVRLPHNARLRLDANGGWDRSTAGVWLERLRQESRFDWLEQPLAVDDHEGLEQLAQRGSVALDESLERRPELRDSWMGWQVRRPAVDGDPRPLLRQIQAGVPYRMVSTAFESGIARRWVHHLAALQWVGPTPAAPGLAPGWCPEGALFSHNPELVWAAAG
jgi:O-succinylbenzoate synthase